MKTQRKLSIQVPLFNTYLDEEFSQNINNHDYSIREVDIGDITFQSTRIEPIHRWFRLTPSYSPGLVRYFISNYGISKNSFVLDPFGGRGTTAIECHLNGIQSITVEINPLLHKVINFSVNHPGTKQKLIDDYINKLKSEIKKYESTTLEDLLLALKISIPGIHDVYRWWKVEVLKDLLIAKKLMKAKQFESIFEMLWLALNSACLDCANIHRNHPTITFHDDHTRDINVFEDITKNLNNINEDLEFFDKSVNQNSARALTVLGDSCNLNNSINSNSTQITHVITSPPYPNRFSYVHQTRPQLFFMDVVKDRSEPTEIDLKTIGGTWGKATSNLMKSLIEVPDDIMKYLSFYDDLSQKNILMCNYATKYFIDMARHIESLKQCVKSGFRGAYVVGNSRLSGVEIYTEQILAKIFEHYGFEIEEIVVFRKRGGRQRLYESAVCVKID